MRTQVAPLREISDLHRKLTGYLIKSLFRQPEDFREAGRHEQFSLLFQEGARGW